MKTRILALTILAAGLAGCQDLEIVNTNNPDRRRALSQPGDVEILAASTFRNLWSAMHNEDDSYNTLTVVADVFTATYANNAALELSSEPRPPFNNNTLSDAHNVARMPWEHFYRAISSANDALFAINDGLIIETPTTTGGTVGDNTNRTYAFSLWTRAIAHLYLAALFDKNFIVREDADLEDPLQNPLVEYPASMDSALALVDEATAFLNANPFTTIETWINGLALTNVDLAMILNSYAARMIVYAARTPQERAALDWDQVIAYADKGITTNFSPLLQSGQVLQSGFLSRLQQNGTFSAWGDYKFVGMADVSGAYKAWLDLPVAQRERFQITTPDRRLTGATPTSDGLYYRYRADNIFRPERGTYHHSHYQWRRNGGRSTSQNYTILSVDEMNLLRAEAAYYKGDLDLAAQLINTTRTREVRIGSTTYPGLPAVTRDGVPASATCVPRVDGVTCATLLQALMYERIMENQALDTFIAYMDSRGFGRLLRGTFLHLPIPARELETLGLPIYSFGGEGGPGAAQ
jgi:hypothetical protein